jgi:hypothetical protein
MPTTTMKILGAGKDRANANIYRDGVKVGEVVLLSGDGFDLLELLGSEWTASGLPERTPTREELEKDLRMLYGLAPYNTWSNHCYADGYFSSSLKKKYGKEPKDLARDIGLDTSKAGQLV